MSAETNKALATRLVEEVLNQRDMSVADEILSPDIVEHEELPPGVTPQTMFTVLFEAFPDFRATLQHLIAEEDMVVIHMLWSGTHKGEFLGIPATGNRMAMNVIDIMRVADGKFVEHWGVSDTMGMMQQLGVSPG
jgi:predicted ester cyclase